jgi:hypothetical protein
MKAKYLNKFKDKTKVELVSIITNSAQYNGYELEAAHELLRKKTVTFSEYQELTTGKSSFPQFSPTTQDEPPNVFLNILKWIGIILTFPFSVIIIGYYKNKKAKKEYYASNRPHSERIN